jgi:hypothetical protein
VEATGHDWSERARQVHSSLADDYSALLTAGALDPPHVGEPMFIEEAGLNAEERLCLAKVILTAEPPSGPVAVWLAYANAFLSDMYLSLGPLEFYDSRIWDAAFAGQWHTRRRFLRGPARLRELHCGDWPVCDGGECDCGCDFEGRARGQPGTKGHRGSSVDWRPTAGRPRPASSRTTPPM